MISKEEPRHVFDMVAIYSRHYISLFFELSKLFISSTLNYPFFSLSSLSPFLPLSFLPTSIFLASPMGKLPSQSS